MTKCNTRRRYGVSNITCASIIAVFAVQVASAHGTTTPPDEHGARAIEFPDTANHLTLTFDPHTHSVFSDGHVWPRIRVGEAHRDDLDALAVTEHLEYQPHRADIPHPDRNRAYLEAVAAAQGSNLLVVAGSEITRGAPGGHMNAVFLSDANALIKVEIPPVDATDVSAFYDAASQWPAEEAVAAANEQGAFVFWNHSWWGEGITDGKARMGDFHRKLARSGQLHGIEIANGGSYSEEAFEIAEKHDLALIGVSDVHNLIDWDYEPHTGGHRPVTLVFARERSVDAMREAMFEQRTVVWFKNLLIGRPRELDPLLAASMSIASVDQSATTDIVRVTIENHSDAEFQLRNLTDHTFMSQPDIIAIQPHGELSLAVKPEKPRTSFELEFEVQNALRAPKKHPRITWTIEVEPRAEPE